MGTGGSETLILFLISAFNCVGLPNKEVIKRHYTPWWRETTAWWRAGCWPRSSCLCWTRTVPPPAGRGWTCSSVWPRRPETRVRRIKASKVIRKRRDNLCCSNKAVTHRLPLGIVNGAVEDCPAARGHGHVPGGPCQVYYRWRSIQDLIQNVIIRIWWRTSDSRVWSFWKFLIQANLKRNASKTNLQL